MSEEEIQAAVSQTEDFFLWLYSVIEASLVALRLNLEHKHACGDNAYVL